MSGIIPPVYYIPCGIGSVCGISKLQYVIVELLAASVFVTCQGLITISVQAVNVYARCTFIFAIEYRAYHCEDLTGRMFTCKNTY